MKPKISRQDIRDCARRMIEYLDGQGIDSLESLHSRINTEFTTTDLPHHSIQIAWRPSNPLGTMALAISYTWQGRGIPIEAKANPILNYTKVIVKCEQIIEKYAP